MGSGCQSVRLIISQPWQIALILFMLSLILSIICSAILVLLFKYFERNNIPVFQAIVFNYWTAALCGFIFLPDKAPVYNLSIFSEPWMPVCLGLGVMFITAFTLTGITTKYFGVSIASVAMKLGLVFPVMLAFTVYGEEFNVLKLVGIILAFVAVILSSLSENTSAEGGKKKASHAYLPVIVFIGSGACDAVTQFATKQFLGNSGTEGFAMFIFVSAGIAGTLVWLGQVFTGKSTFNYKCLIGGIVLGITNYFSYLFALKALTEIKWGSSVVFPVINLGVVAFVTLGGILLFREKISRLNAIGLACAAASIIVIILSGN